MKKVLIGMLAVAVAVGFAIRAYSAEVKESTTTKGGTTIEKTEVKSGDVKAKSETKITEDKTVEKTEVKGKNVKAKSETTTTAEGTVTKEKVEGQNVRMERETAETATPVAAGGAEAGRTRIQVKKGAIRDAQVEWVLWRDKSEYIIEYEVKDKIVDKKALADMNLTAEQAATIKPGVHKIVSTSPYTAEDIKNDFRAVILKDLASSIQRTK